MLLAVVKASANAIAMVVVSVVKLKDVWLNVIFADSQGIDHDNHSHRDR